MPATHLPGRALVSSVLREANPRVTAAWRALESVEDPEIPAVSVVDLGLIRFINMQPDQCLHVGLSPTYVGCPATEVIKRLVSDALKVAQIGAFEINEVLSPAWSSDWISADGRRKLLDYGIVPPERSVANMREVLRADKPVACPRCHSLQTETLSEFGSTPCKALHRCRACLEPFEYFKCI
jgi:ring-1,2-phenylacetyl-CoA epoxidase subunit PaaD